MNISPGQKTQKKIRNSKTLMANSILLGTTVDLFSCKKEGHANRTDMHITANQASKDDMCLTRGGWGEMRETRHKACANKRKPIACSSHYSSSCLRQKYKGKLSLK